MKGLLTTLVAGLVAGSAFGQGGIVMNTRGGGVDAPVVSALTGQRIEGQAWLAQLYYGAAGAFETSLVPVLDAPYPGGTVAAPAWFGTGAAAGYILTSTGGGNRYTDPAIAAPGAITSFQLRVWEASLGNTWEEALGNWSWDTILGKSAIIAVRTSASILDPPKPLLGLTAFTIGIPEPNVIALGALGLMALLWHRRKWSTRFSD